MISGDVTPVCCLGLLCPLRKLSDLGSVNRVSGVLVTFSTSVFLCADGVIL